ncbi:MAG: DMT family transporter [Vulcanimicrobiaceae bacterium]
MSTAAKPRFVLADLVALATVTIWGTGFVVQKIALDQIDPLGFTFVRYAVMLGLAWIGFAAAGGESIARGDRQRVLWTGVLGYSCYILLSTIGLRYTTAFSNALLIGTAPLMTIGLLAAAGMERISRNQVLAALAALVGVLVFISAKIGARMHTAGIGDAICLAAALCFAAYAVVNKPLLSKYRLSTVMAWTLTAGTLPVLLATLPVALAEPWRSVTPVGWAAIAWSSIVPVYVAWNLWNWSTQRIGLARTSIYMYLIPIVGGFTSWALLGERFGSEKVVGALLILGSLVISRFNQRGPDR